VPVSGKLTHDKEAVKGGTLIFNPVETKDSPGAQAATAEVQSDGSFTMMTNTTKGVRPGKYRVGYTPPPQELTEEQRKDPKYIAPPPPYMGLVPEPAEVVVKQGTGSITLELVSGSAPAPKKK